LTEIKSILLPVAPPKEQHRIVEEIETQLSRLEAGVSALKRAGANLKRYRAAILKAACEGRLVPTEAELALAEGREYERGACLLDLSTMLSPEANDSSVLGEVPEGWAISTLGSLADIKGGITKDQKRKHPQPCRLVPYLRVANVQRGSLDLGQVKEIEATEETIRQLKLRKGDILLNEGGDRDKLGRGWIWNEELPECIHQNHVFRARLAHAKMNTKFVSWYANTFGQQFFFDEGKQTTNLASISMSKLKTLPIPVPPPAEQERIVAELERCLSLVDELEATITANLHRATRLRISILHKAFDP
jgi:type I restriction enzyme S subunit